MNSPILASYVTDTTHAIERVSVQAMDNILGHTFGVLDHGFIRVIDYMGDDSSVVQAARVSYGTGTEAVQSDTGLINYLLRHDHTTPFEMCEIKLHVKLPVFVARQWIRHRMANVNEYSARYSILDKEFYFPDPDDLAPQSKDNKQGRAGSYDQQMKDSISYVLKEGAEEAYGDYQLLIQEGNDPSADDYGYGLARELGRMVLPTNIYTQWYWKTDLHNLMRFMRLRADSHAQKEIRVYAEMIERIVAEWTPATFGAYQSYIKNVLKFSSKELEALALIMNTEQGRIMIDVFKKMDVSMLQGVGTFSKGEWKEFLVKLESIEKQFK